MIPSQKPQYHLSTINSGRVKNYYCRVASINTGYKFKSIFFPKGHSTYASKIPFISNLKRPLIYGL